MGHIVGKDLYRRLGQKVDHHTVRAPWSETFHEILRELYSAEEADLVCRMPNTLTTLRGLQRITGEDEATLRKILDGICTKGLVIDIEVGDKTYYMPSPYMAGIYEFTMMRTDSGVDSKKMARRPCTPRGWDRTPPLSSSPIQRRSCAHLIH